MVWKDQVRHEPDRIDRVALAGLLLGNRRSPLRRCLALLIPRDADLEARRAACEREGPDQGVVEIARIARLRAGALLRGVPLVEFECREGHGVAAGELHR